MKKNILNEELGSMKYLFDYKRGRVISEQTTYYKGADGKVGVLQGPYALPQGATAITQQEYQTASATQPTTGTQQQPATQATQQQPETQATQQKTYSSLADYVKEAQTLLGVTADGKFGPKTLEALKSKLGTSGTQQSSTGTTQTSTTGSTTGNTTSQSCPPGQVFDQTIQKCTLPAVTVYGNKSGTQQTAQTGTQQTAQTGEQPGEGADF